MTEHEIMTEGEQLSEENPTPEQESTEEIPENVTQGGENEEMPEDDGEYADGAEYGSECDDLTLLMADFPELRGLSEIESMRSYERYRALREVGLTPREAYLATTPKTKAPNTRSHLKAAPMHTAHRPTGGMTRTEIEMARRLFDGLSDGEIHKLYRKVTN